MSDAELNNESSHVVVPMPDPTRMTTAQLLMAISSLKELVFTRLDGNDKAMELFNDNITRVPTDTDKQISHLKGLHDSRFEQLERSFNVRFDGIEAHALAVREILETRMNGNDTAVKLLQESSDRIPNTVDEKISALEEVNQEKFDSIQTQFRERDVRSERESKDNKVAVDAALSAQKEASAAQNDSNITAIAKSEAGFTKQIDQISVLIANGSKSLDDKINELKERFLFGQGIVQEKKDQVVTQHGANANILTIVGIVAGLIGAVVGKFL